MTARLRRLAALALVVLIVSSSVAAPVAGATVPTGTAAIDAPDGEPYTSGSGTCSYSGLFNLLGVNLNVDCGPSAPEQTTDNATKGDIYQDAAETKSWLETTTSQTHNSLQNLQTTLYAYGEAEQNAVIENGTTSVSQVNLAVNQTVDERVAEMQFNQIQSWNQMLQSYRNMENASEQAGLSEAYVSPNPSLGTGHTDYNGPTRLYSYQFQNRTLANGSTAKALVAYYGDQDGTSTSSEYRLSISEHPMRVHLGGGSYHTPGFYLNLTIKAASDSNTQLCTLK